MERRARWRATSSSALPAPASALKGLEETIRTCYSTSSRGAARRRGGGRWPGPAGQPPRTVGGPWRGARASQEQQRGRLVVLQYVAAIPLVHGEPPQPSKSTRRRGARHAALRRSRPSGHASCAHQGCVASPSPPRCSWLASCFCWGRARRRVADAGGGGGKRVAVGTQPHGHGSMCGENDMWSHLVYPLIK